MFPARYGHATRTRSRSLLLNSKKLLCIGAEHQLPFFLGDVQALHELHPVREPLLANRVGAPEQEPVGADTFTAHSTTGAPQAEVTVMPSRCWVYRCFLALAEPATSKRSSSSFTFDGLGARSSAYAKNPPPSMLCSSFRFGNSSKRSLNIPCPRRWPGPGICRTAAEGVIVQNGIVLHRQNRVVHANRHVEFGHLLEKRTEFLGVKVKRTVMGSHLDPDASSSFTHRSSS